LILLQIQGLLLISQKTEPAPKRPKKASTIPKNRTGSGRQIGNRGTNRLEPDAVPYDEHEKKDEENSVWFTEYEEIYRFEDRRIVCSVAGICPNGLQPAIEFRLRELDKN
jgi:hypothetical protein